MQNHLKTVSNFIIVHDNTKYYLLYQAGEHLQFQNKIEITNKISSSCIETFQEMKIRRKHRYIIFKIGDEEIEGSSI